EFLCQIRPTLNQPFLLPLTDVLGPHRSGHDAPKRWKEPTLEHWTHIDPTVATSVLHSAIDNVTGLVNRNGLPSLASHVAPKIVDVLLRIVDALKVSWSIRITARVPRAFVIEVTPVHIGRLRESMLCEL